MSEVPCRGFPEQDEDLSTSEKNLEGTSSTSSNSSDVILEDSITEPLEFSPLTSSTSSIEPEDDVQTGSVNLHIEEEQRQSWSGICCCNFFINNT